MDRKKFGPQNSKCQIAENGQKQDLAFGIPNSQLLPLESPWQFHEQKFGIGISMDRSLGPKLTLVRVYVEY